jgi:hypothetical protein
MIFLSKTRGVQPQIQPQTVTQLDGELLIISFPKVWREKRDFTSHTVSSPANEAKATLAAYRGYKTLSAFENWLFSQEHSRYNQVGPALVYTPYKQTGLGRRFSVNQLDIVIREYQDTNKLSYLGVAGIRIRNASVSVIFETKSNALPKNLL